MSSFKLDEELLDRIYSQAERLDDAENTARIFEGLVNAYKSGKIDGLEKAFSEIDINIDKEVED